MTTLLMSSRYTDDDQALWRVAIQRGWTVERVRGIRIPELAADEEIIIYVEPLYGPTIAAALGVRLLEPPEDWLAHLPAELVQRTMEHHGGDDPRRRAPPLAPGLHQASERQVLRGSGLRLRRRSADCRELVTGGPRVLSGPPMAR